MWVILCSGVERVKAVSFDQKVWVQIQSNVTGPQDKRKKTPLRFKEIAHCRFVLIKCFTCQRKLNATNYIKNFIVDHRASF